MGGLHLYQSGLVTYLISYIFYIETHTCLSILFLCEQNILQFFNLIIGYFILRCIFIRTYLFFLGLVLILFDLCCFRLLSLSIPVFCISHSFDVTFILSRFFQLSNCVCVCVK